MLRIFAALLLIISLAGPVYSGSTTTHGYFYKPSYGEKGPASYLSYTAALDATDLVLYGLEGLGTLVANWAIEDNIVTLITATATYSDNNTFTLPGNYTSRFPAGAVVQVQVAAGMAYSTVASSSYAAPTTTVNLNDTVLTNPITRIYVVATRDGLWPNGPGYIVAADYGTDHAALAAADAVAVAAGKQLLIGRTYSVTDNLTLSANLQILPGAILSVATTKTLTFNQDPDAGDYQIFSLTGTGAVAGLKTTRAVWFGLNDDGTTDDYAAILAAYSATATGGRLIFPRPTTGLALSTTFAIAKPIIIEFQGDAYVTDKDWSATSTPIFVWTGGATPMISLTNSAGVFFEGNACLNAASTATFGLYADRMRFGGWKGTLLVWNPATAGVKFYTSSAVASDNTMFNQFGHIIVRGPQALIMDSVGTTANVCHNLIEKLTATFTGNNSLDLISCDNNTINEVYLYRHTTEGLTTGNGLRFGQYAYSNQLGHFQGPVYQGAGSETGTGTCLVDTPAITDSGLGTNTIFNYDMTNGQALPNMTDLSIRSATYKWTASGSGTNEYYLELAAGGNPVLPHKPRQVVENAVKINYNALGSLSASEWGYGDNDTLGYSTVYIRLSDGTDPDTKALGYITARFSGLTYYANGKGNFGTYIPRFWMGGDVRHTTTGGEWTEYYDHSTGAGFRFRLNPSSRKLEAWHSSSGAYAKIFDFSAAGIYVTWTDLTVSYQGKGVVMTNAAGTVTKRVRLNDAGDGLIYEAP